jgi:peroxiredoxin Q/BCP
MPSSFRKNYKAAIGLALILAAPLVAEPPRLGHKAPDFSLPRLGGGMLRLSSASAKSPVVLIVLRGYPGYQCPFCKRQAQDFLRKAKNFRDAGVTVLMVYPGAAEGLGMRASEFASETTLPDGFEMLLDPDYRFTQLYDLRWDAPKETAYPSTFVINQQGVVTFVKVSREHGGRTTAAEVLEVLVKLAR